MWLDWVALLVVALYALRGFREGITRQFFRLLGWICGYVSLMAVSQWVGAHWQGARPSVVFGVLRWLVALLAGFAVVAIFEILGERIGDGLKKSVLAGVDRIAGIAMGGVLGLVFWILVLVALLHTPWPRGARAVAADARTTGPLLGGARRVLVVDDRIVPGLKTVRGVLTEASRRAGESPRKS